MYEYILTILAADETITLGALNHFTVLFPWCCFVSFTLM